MSRVSLADARAIAEVNRALVTFEAGGPSGIEIVARDAPSLLGTPAWSAYGLDIDDRGACTVSWAFARGFPVPDPDACQIFRGFIDRTQSFAYTPVRPERRQRNRVVVSPPLGSLAAPRSGAARRRRELWLRALDLRQGTKSLSDHLGRVESDLYPSLGLLGLSTMRVLVCDGPALLAFVGGFGEGPVERRRGLFARLVPALARRLRLERQLGMARFHETALAAALEAISAPAVVLDVRGRPVLTNALGRELSARDLTRLRDATALPSRGEPDVERTTLLSPGLPPHTLVVLRSARGDQMERLAAASSAWELTPRQIDVLEHLALGDANKTIAAKLGCAESTVELRVTQLLGLAGVESRAALVARFWRAEWSRT